VLLGGHSQLVGLGEAGIGVQADGPRLHRKAPCSCGQLHAECPFWGEILPTLRDDMSDAQRYAKVFETFAQHFGPHRLPVDSTKYLSFLDVLRSELHYDVRVIFLVRDVRGYIVSQLRNLQRKGQNHWKMRLIGPANYFALRWYRENRAIERYLTDHGVPHLRIGYEELCFFPEQIVGLLCGFLGLKPEPAMLRLRPWESHVLWRNRMRRLRGQQTLSYDLRWLVREDWRWPTTLLPFVLAYSRRRVYANVAERLSEH
jgi:hypothetical protein